MSRKKIVIDIFLFLQKSDAFAEKQSSNNTNLFTLGKKKMLNRVTFEILTKTIIIRQYHALIF